jgi:hypothetical protein
MVNESLTRIEDLVEGRYRIGVVISRSARSTVYETEPGDHAAAVVKVREKDTDGGEDPLNQWQSAMGLAHPNLLKLYAVGSSVLNEAPVIYAVMERADESLEGVLPARPLTTDEAREMLMSTAAALRYLHEHGYAHSRLRTSNVLAVGDQIKLSSDSIIRVDDGGSAAEDMKDFGALIVQALTQRLPDGHVPADIPEPFREIAQRCFHPDPDRRWTAGQVLARLAKPEFVRPLPTHQLHMERIPVAKPLADAERPQEPREEESRDEHTPAKRIPNWIYAALAALLVIVFVVAGLRKKNPPEHASVPARVVEQAPPAEVPSPAPLTAPAIPQHADRAPAVAGTSDPKADGWSVIVAAYASREPAEKRMHAMAARWRNFSPNVLQPRSGRTHFIVVLGQNLSEDQAEALRKRAVAAGFPRDTYIKRLM